MSRILAGRFERRRELARGGSATVYLAEEHTHGRAVAVKGLHPERAASIGAARFLREIGIALARAHARTAPTAPASSAATSVTTPGLVIGTPRDMSPEQAADESDLLPASDVYSLACVVVAMLAGPPGARTRPPCRRIVACARSASFPSSTPVPMRRTNT